MPRVVLQLDAIARLAEIDVPGGVGEVAAAAALAQLGGATGFTLSLQAAMLGERVAAARLLQGLWGAAFEVEIAPDRELLSAALALHPRRVLMSAPHPGDPAEPAPLDLLTQSRPVAEVLTGLEELGSQAVLRIAPDVDQVKAAHRLGAGAICLHVARHAVESGAVEPLLPTAVTPPSELAAGALGDAARLGRKLGLAVCIGGDVGGEAGPHIRSLADVSALYLGRPVIARAVSVGLERAVREAVTGVAV